MNYLAHLHIANHCDSSLLGNLLGDFVKGNPDDQLPAHLSSGVKLHRFVDSYTDQHSIVVEVKQLFPNGLRRFSCIALDMFWDHCLAKRWNEYHTDSLSRFCRHAEHTVRADNGHSLPERFIHVSDAMWQGRWLESYRHFENIEYALQRMSRRSPRMQRLSECSMPLFNHYEQLNETFSRFYPDLLTASKSF
ncbi:ACP phosphodiesterase [Vibrio tubiashii]|nr:ACP phosphodiesterase [Vibrio tubiashii]